MTPDRHEDHRENTAAYLLGALDDLERADFERHLAGCPDCRDEVEALRPALEALPRSVTPVAPPPALKASLMEIVEREARERTGTARAPRRLPRFGGGLRLSPAFAAAAAVLVLAVGVATGLGLAALGDESAATSSTVVAQVDGQRLPGAAGDLTIAPDRASAVLEVRDMPPLPDDRSYQVWVRRGGAIIPGSLFRVSADGRGSTAVDRSLEGVDAVMVTREPADGSQAPSEDPVMIVPV